MASATTENTLGDRIVEKLSGKDVLDIQQCAEQSIAPVAQ
jgi:hypothetical protein